MRVVMREENWSKATQHVEETFVPIPAERIFKAGVQDCFRSLNAAFNALSPPSIDVDLPPPPVDPRTIKLASYAHPLTEDLRDAQEFRRLWTMMLDAPSDFVQVWHIFLAEHDPRRNYMLNIASNLASQSHKDSEAAVEVRRIWSDLITNGLCDLFPALSYRMHSNVST